MPVVIDGTVELTKALKEANPILHKEVQKEIAGHLRSIVNKARGYVPSTAPLSGWANDVGEWGYRAFDAGTIKRGITYSTTPSRPNKRGFRTLAAIYNKSAAGAIYETAGRKNPQGQKPSNRAYSYTQKKMVWNSDRTMNRSANPNAGRQFIDALPPLVDSQQSNSPGRRTRKTKGRLMFKVWAEDQGRTTAAVVKAIEASNQKVVQLAYWQGSKVFRAKVKNG
tara:strand:- start:1322 stop:1993 length:672 start_codon:yes stop_codon:yes gene_type:complete